jgi:hypothetical protein
VTALEKLTVIDPAPYKYKVAFTAALRQQDGGRSPPWDGIEESSATVGDLAGSFDFRGLRSLMQLRRLETFVIGNDTFLFDSRSNVHVPVDSSYDDYYYDYTEDEEMQLQLHEEMQMEIQRRMQMRRGLKGFEKPVSS